MYNSDLITTLPIGQGAILNNDCQSHRVMEARHGAAHQRAIGRVPPVPDAVKLAATHSDHLLGTEMEQPRTTCKLDMR